MQAAGTAIFRIHLTIGPDYAPGKTRLVFDFPATVGMSRPSLMHQEDYGYLQAYVSNAQVRYDLRVWDLEIQDFAQKGKGSWRGMAARMGVLDLDEGLQEGDTIELVWGDPGRGYGPGVQVTHVSPRPDYACTIHVRYFDSPEKGLPDYARSFEGHDRPEPDYVEALSFSVSPREPEMLRMIRKHDKALLLPLDPYWNISEVKDIGALVEGGDGATKNSMHGFEYADKNVQIKSKGLPLIDGPDMSDVHEGYNLYWGDIHTHTAFSIDCFEREKMDMRPGDLMRYARDHSGLDFYAPTDHNEPHHSPRNHIGKERWEEMIASIGDFNKDGEFLVFPGMEYRCDRGDTTVVYNWLPEYGEINRSEWEDIRKLWTGLEGKDFLTIPHFHNGGKLPEGEWWRGPEYSEPVVEMFSCHGSYERPDALEQHIPIMKSSRPDRYASWMLNQGIKFGFVCNSDGHKGHVGSNGITAVFAKELTKEAIMEAYRERRVYGTTNARIRLVFTANGALMGSTIPNTAEKVFHIDVASEWPLKKVELFRNTEPCKLFEAEGTRFQTELKVQDDEPSNWYVRATQLDNQIAWSSPVWFE